MAAIVFALKEWRHYLVDAAHPFEILTDHQNLTYFKRPQDLNHRQARWAHFLQQYHFTMTHRSGKTNPADPLSWRPDFEKGVELDNTTQILLPEKLFSSPPHSPVEDAAAVCLLQVEKQSNNAEAAVRLSDSIESMVESLQHKCEKYAQKGMAKKPDLWKEYEKVLLYKDLLYIPKDDQLREKILKEHHDHPLAGHPGMRRTKDLILAKYYWPTIRKDVESYVKGCNKCQKTKTITTASRTPLHPNEIPQNPWEIISVDIIGPSPESQGKNAILVVVDRFSKMIRLFAVSTDITAKGVATIFQDQIFKLHGTPLKVISDRGPQFVSSFMESLYDLLKIEGNPSTAYHPQTDGQTERFNSQIEQYLRLYTNHPQNDWVEWLALAEFAHNQKTSVTGFSPFMVNYGQQPNIRGEHQKQVRNESAKDFVETMKGTIKLAKESLEHVALDMKKYYDRKVRPSIEYKKGDLVLLEGTNIRSERPSKKLDDKRFGPFKIVEKVGKAAYKLKLDAKWRNVHPVFHESLLHPYASPTFPTQQKPPPPPPDLIQGVEEQEIEEILASWERRGNIEYLVSWKGFPSEENEWITAAKLTHATDTIKSFHRSHPTAPRPQKKMQLWYNADQPDSPCTCPICIPAHSVTMEFTPSSSLFSSPKFLEFCSHFRCFDDSYFDFPSAADVTP